MNLSIQTTDDGTDWVFLGHYRVARVEPGLPHHLLTELREHEGDLEARIEAALEEYRKETERGSADAYDEGFENGRSEGYDKGWGDGYSSGCSGHDDEAASE